jgi:hypothetical protein
MLLHRHVAVVVRGVEEGVAGAAGLVAEVGDERATVPMPFVRGACAEVDAYSLGARVVLDWLLSDL